MEIDIRRTISRLSRHSRQQADVERVIDFLRLPVSKVFGGGQKKASSRWLGGSSLRQQMQCRSNLITLMCAPIDEEAGH
jgi:hypothetical protein